MNKIVEAAELARYQAECLRNFKKLSQKQLEKRFTMYNAQIITERNKNHYASGKGYNSRLHARYCAAVGILSEQAKTNERVRNLLMEIGRKGIIYMVKVVDKDGNVLEEFERPRGWKRPAGYRIAKNAHVKRQRTA